VSEKSVEKVKAELQRRRRSILETSRLADAEIEALRAVERVSEFEEGAQSEHEQFTLSRLSETQRLEIAQIDAALARLEAGEYGVCRDCGGDIDPRRLSALPYALLCTECASHRERTPGAAVPEASGR
jgi:DnaK suppressor protein